MQSSSHLYRPLGFKCQLSPLTGLSLTPLSPSLLASASSPPTMADRNSNQQRSPGTTSMTSTLLRKLQSYAPNSTHIVGLLTFVISGSVLLFLTGLTVTAVVLGLIFFAPLIIFSSPIWVPMGTILFIVIAGFLSVCGFVVTVVVGLAWLYRYFKGMNPPGSDRVDHARSRIYNTASHVKDYAREYGEYFQSKVKDAAPGA